MEIQFPCRFYSLPVYTGYQRIRYEENVMNQYVKIIMQSNDFEADWDNFVQYLYKNHNLEAVTKEVNEEAIRRVLNGSLINRVLRLCSLIIQKQQGLNIIPAARIYFLKRFIGNKVRRLLLSFL